MDKDDAVIALIHEYLSDRKPTVTAYKRIARACDVLGLNEDERVRLLCYLHFYDYETKQPYPWLAAKL